MRGRTAVHAMAAAFAGLLVCVWPAAARATPDFPAAVVQDLGLPGITVDAPQGCTLCHTTDAGGTSLKEFGHLLQQDGLQPYDEPSLAQALAQVGQEEPQLIDDIRTGVDPSADAANTGNVHTPEYGCAVARLGAGGAGGRGRERGGGPEGAWAGAASLVVAWLLRRRLRTSTGPARPRRSARARA
jgi:hypothetical protein